MLFSSSGSALCLPIFVSLNERIPCEDTRVKWMLPRSSLGERERSVLTTVRRLVEAEVGRSHLLFQQLETEAGGLS